MTTEGLSTPTPLTQGRKGLVSRNKCYWGEAFAFLVILPGRAASWECPDVGPWTGQIFHLPTNLSFLPKSLPSPRDASDQTSPQVQSLQDSFPWDLSSLALGWPHLTSSAFEIFVNLGLRAGPQHPPCPSQDGPPAAERNEMLVSSTPREEIPEASPDTHVSS